MNVGDYVRTRQGNVFKWDKYMTTVKDNIRDVDSPYIYISQNDIIKSSPNIIDLIEVGDYVNGFKVVWKDINKKEFSIHSYYASENIINNSKKIKSIVTKEQFESIEYRIGE